jgi:hypothetical protein
VQALVPDGLTPEKLLKALETALGLDEVVDALHFLFVDLVAPDQHLQELEG